MTLHEKIRATTAKGQSAALEREFRAPPGGKGRASVRPLHKDHHNLERPPFECIALVLQGGGALGAFQAGVYQALAEADLHPDWVAGISIGAINAALIAGNPPETRIDKLRAFWEQATASPAIDMWSLAEAWMRGDVARGYMNQLHAAEALFRGVPGFYAPRVLPPALRFAGTVDATSYYDTTALRGTLERLIDFDRINAGDTRFSVGAVNVRTGNFVFFDSTSHRIRPEHIMASGALPPGFPAVEVDGEHYWDGGLVSNTPLQWVVSSGVRQDTLAFQVDLWSARGEAPNDLGEVLVRQKEIQYSSRTRANTDQFRLIQSVRGALANLIDKLPPALLENDEDAKLLRSVADRKVYNIVQLIYRSKHYERQSKDYNFSRVSMHEHWEAGYNYAVRTLRHPEALQRPLDSTGVSTFDVGVDGRE
jgi:NTE family protein